MPAKPSFENRDGTLTAYALACGYMEVSNRDYLSTRLYKEGGVYHVLTYDYNEHKRLAWETFDTLAPARREYRRQCRLTREA